MECWECRDAMAAAARRGEHPGVAAAHLARCRACRDFAAQLTSVETALSRWEAPAAAEGAAAREALAARLTAAPPCVTERASRSLVACLASDPTRWVRGTAVTAAAMVFLVLLGLALARWRDGREEKHAGLPIAPGSPTREVAVPRVDAGHPSGTVRSRLARLSPTLPATLPQSERLSSDTAGPERSARPWPRALVPHLERSNGDLAGLNGGPTSTRRPPTALTGDPWACLEARLRRQVPVRDDFLQIPFPRLAAASDRQVVAAAESYRREAAMVDNRLFREITLQQKATALSDLCERLRADTGIALAAGSSVADEKVTLFCRKMPLREVMRQLSRPFGYAWVRSGKEDEYRYELVQDLRSQLLEEELRNRDRNAALLALEREIDRYRPYLGLSPDEAQARAKVAAPAEKKLLENLAGLGWGPIQMYFRLSHSDLAALRAGQRLRFSTAPKPNEPETQRPLPPDLRRGLLECNRGWRVIKNERGYSLSSDLSDPRGVATTALPDVHAQVTLRMVQSELGVLALSGQSGCFMAHQFGTLDGSGPLATGMSPAVRDPGNGTANARLARDPALRARVSIQPQPSCGSAPAPQPPPSGLPSPLRGGAEGTGAERSRGDARGPSESRVTSADVLWALHQSTGRNIVSDYYTRLYKPSEVSVTRQALFDVLNHLADAMRLRWTRDGEWLQLRSTGYYNDRLKEVPNRLLTHWAAARRQHGALTLDELCEIAQLPDAQLDAASMAEGARLCFGLDEWGLAANGVKRADLRFLAGFTPAQRQAALSAAGLSFAQMSLAQQQRYLTLAFGPDDEPLQSLDELAGATLRVDYSLPGMFEWRVPGPPWLQWVTPIVPGPEGRRVPRPPVRERTREAALQALRRVDPEIRQAVLQAAGRVDPRLVAAPSTEEAQIVPSRMDLAIIYIPGASNRRAMRARFDYNDTDSLTW